MIVLGKLYDGKSKKKNWYKLISDEILKIILFKKI